MVTVKLDNDKLVLGLANVIYLKNLGKVSVEFQTNGELDEGNLHSLCSACVRLPSQLQAPPLVHGMRSRSQVNA